MIMNHIRTGEKTVEVFLEKHGNTSVEALQTEAIESGEDAVHNFLAKHGNIQIKAFDTVTFKDELRDAFPVLNDEVDSSFLLDLLYFFPIEKTYISTGSYDQYLYDLEKTVIDNYETGNFQVSFFYAHLVFMSYVYYCVEKAYQLEPERMKDIFYPINSYHGQDDKPDIENFGNVYEFSKIPEKDIFKVFHIMGMDDAQIKSFSKYISTRDDFAHATGKGNISEQEFEQNIKSVIGNMNSLMELFKPHIKEIYISFMLERLDYDYDGIMDNFNDFVFDNGLSILDLDYLCHLGVRNLQDSNETLKINYQATRNIHCALMEYCLENDGIEPPVAYNSLRNEKYLYFRYRDKADNFITNELGIDIYRCIKEGGRLPLYECPECGAEQLAFDESKGKYHCFSCDANYSTEDLSFCARCGDIMKRNDDVSICPNCIDHMLEE